MAMGGIVRWKDGRNMPDVHASIFEYAKLGSVPVYLRLNLGTETPEVYKFMGSKGILEVNSESVTYTPQSGDDDGPCYYPESFAKPLRDDYLKQWRDNTTRWARKRLWKACDLQVLRGTN